MPAPRKTGWWVFDRETHTVHRGPFDHEETAGAVRLEMEHYEPNKNWNLSVWYGDRKEFDRLYHDAKDATAGHG
jgi:hypothetical protein